MKINAFGASSCKNSINKQFAIYASSFFNSNDVDIVDLKNYPLRLFTIDTENDTDYHPIALDFVNKLNEAT